MKFQELALQSQFTIANEERVFTKIEKRKASCCTPTYNAFSGKKKKRNVRLFNGDQDITPVESEEQNVEPPEPKTNEPRQPRQPQKAMGGGGFGG